jgi:hypothetical protein
MNQIMKILVIMKYKTKNNKYKKNYKNNYKNNLSYQMFLSILNR